MNNKDILESYMQLEMSLSDDDDFVLGDTSAPSEEEAEQEEPTVARDSKWVWYVCRLVLSVGALTLAIAEAGSAFVGFFLGVLSLLLGMFLLVFLVSTSRNDISFYEKMRKFSWVGLVCVPAFFILHFTVYTL